MAILLKADNRTLLTDAKYSYLLDNSSSGASSIVVANTDGFSANCFIVIGSIGSEGTELIQVNTVTASTGTLSLVGTTRFAHSESTRVTVVPYDKVRFYYTTTPTVPNPSASPVTTVTTIQNSSITDTNTEVITSPTTATYTNSIDPTDTRTVDITPPIVFNGTTPLTGAIAIQVDSNYSTYSDTAHTTGYGWFAFYNSVTLVYSATSNPIPYAGFDPNTVAEIFNSFNSCLNQKELRLISTEDRFSWLNEAYARMINELNLGNWEYNATLPLTLTIKAGVTTYLLPEDFGNLLYINESNGDKIDSYDATFQPARTVSTRRYRIIGKYIMFDPAPDADGTVTLSYLKNSNLLRNLSDVVNLPDKAHYGIKDFMLFRAHRKMGNLTESNNAMALFQKDVDNMKLFSIKRDNSLDNWQIANEANI